MLEGRKIIQRPLMKCEGLALDLPAEHQFQALKMRIGGGHGHGCRGLLRAQYLRSAVVFAPSIVVVDQLPRINHSFISGGGGVVTRKGRVVCGDIDRGSEDGKGLLGHKWRREKQRPESRA